MTHAVLLFKEDDDSLVTHILGWRWGGCGCGGWGGGGGWVRGMLEAERRTNRPPIWM